MKISKSAQKAFGELGTVVLAAAVTAGITFVSANLASFDVPLIAQPVILAALAALGRYISQKVKHPENP